MQMGAMGGRSDKGQRRQPIALSLALSLHVLLSCLAANCDSSSVKQKAYKLMAHLSAKYRIHSK
jgi:hypothetical protein